MCAVGSEECIFPFHPACSFMLYPLRFQPLFRRYLWGGRRLESVLSKQLGSGDDYAESWEIVDRGMDQSTVAVGPLAGRTLTQLLAEYRSDMLGRHSSLGRFPLLLKFLDCHHDLSVQVHPNDAQAALLDPPDLGKSEAWVVLESDAGSKIYAGLKPDVSCQHRLEQAQVRQTARTRRGVDL